MKCVQSNKLDFSGQNIYVGIDVIKQLSQMELKVCRVKWQVQN